MLPVIAVLPGAAAVFMLTTSPKAKATAPGRRHPLLPAAAAALVGLLCGALTGALWLPVMLPALVTVAGPMVGAIATQQRRARISAQMVDGLTLVANCAQAGLSLTQSLQTAALDVPDPLSAELRRVCTEASLGADLGEALRRMAARARNDDVSLFVAALEVQRHTGGQLAPILLTLAATIRDRQRLSTKMRAATAQGRLSGVVTMCIPAGLYVGVSAIEPGYFDPMIHTSTGIVLTGLLVVMNILGAASMWRLSQLRH